MGIWIPNILGAQNQTFIKYWATLDNYEKLFRVGECTYSPAILQTLF